jgi:hypothetical protein
VVADPGLAIAEADADNNDQILSIGGVAAPVGLWAQIESGNALVFLGWDAVADRGWRVIASIGPKMVGLGSQSAPASRPATWI